MPVTSKSARPVGRPPDTDLQERRRAEILDAATTIFAEHGFAAADVQEIANKTGVGKGTVYRYFPSKEDLFLAAVDHGMRSLKQAINAATTETEEPLERIAQGVRGYLTFFDENPKIVELLIHERAHFRDRKEPTYFVHREANLGPWRELFRGLIDAGVVRDQPVEQIIEVISGLVYGTMFTNYFAGRKSNLARQCESILNIVFHGILISQEEANHGK